MKKSFLLTFLFFSVISTCFAKQHFDIIFEELIKHEGKTIVKAEDGISKYGLTKYYHKQPAILTQKQAKEIIYEKVYKKHNIEQLKTLRLQHICLDFIYHTNPYKAIKIIRNIVKSNNKEPYLDIETIKLLNKTPNVEDKILNQRQRYIKSLKLYNKYKKGWERRISYFREENYLIENKRKYLFQPMFETKHKVALHKIILQQYLLFILNDYNYVKLFIQVGKTRRDYFFYVRKSNFP